jgi:hypothetical protein
VITAPESRSHADHPIGSRGRDRASTKIWILKERLRLKDTPRTQELSGVERAMARVRTALN